MHPSKDIKGSKGSELTDRKIALCITGSAAAVRCPDLARELMRHGAEVRAVMTRNATELITPELMHWATGNPVVSRLTGKLEHVELGQWADLVLVAPSTANTLSKIAHGISDSSVTSVVSVALGLKKPVAIVPAMHESMYTQKLLQSNLTRLKEAGVSLLEPRLEEGKLKMLETGQIVNFAIGLLGPGNMAGMRVLVTAGPTVEPIDPIKIITNRSSGKMGIAIARAAQSRGADVTLIYGPGTESPPLDIRTLRVQTTSEMREAVMRELKEPYDIVVSTAAAQDLMVAEPFERKLKHSEKVEVKLVPAPRILDDVREVAKDAFVIGFKAEYNVTDERLHEASKLKLEEGRLDMVVANDVARAGFGLDTSDVLILTPSGYKRLRATKAEIAKEILDAAITKLRG